VLTDSEVIDRVLNHIDNKTTDMGQEDWQEPVEHYRSIERFNAERALMRRLPIPFCPEAALPENGSYIARTAAGTPLIAVRGDDGVIRAFRNACRHRGMQVALSSGETGGTGCVKLFKCQYHGWAYGLDGTLQHVPHEHGFPDLDKETRPLVPVEVEVSGGLVFITQEEPVGRGALADLPSLIASDQVVFDSGESTSEVNWKLNMEATLEGYHIKPTHEKTFYPYGYDNLTLLEEIGPNSRVTFPFRRIEKLREIPAAERKIDRMVTYVYNVFPFVTVAHLSNHTTINIAEPVSPTLTRYYNYKMGVLDPSKSQVDLERAKKDASFVADTGGREDAAVVRAIQAGIESGANTHFTFGRFERAIVHFHKQLSANLALID
jgi:choline monooxygenase